MDESQQLFRVLGNLEGKMDRLIAIQEDGANRLDLHIKEADHRFHEIENAVNIRFRDLERENTKWTLFSQGFNRVGGWIGAAAVTIVVSLTIAAIFNGVNPMAVIFTNGG